MTDILIIDDSEDDRLLYRRALSRDPAASFRLIEVGDGVEGLSRIDESPPDCVLLDYSLPGHNGLEVLKRIHGNYPFMPVVMLTGQGNETVAVAAMREGAQNYITKSSITPESMQHVVHSAIEHCAMQRRLKEQHESLEIFANALAHDLKEPIRTVRVFLDMFKAKEAISDRGKTYFDHIQSSADRMITLIDAVHLYTRLGNAQEGARREWCEASAVMEHVKQNLDALIKEHKAEITSGPLPKVFANPIQLLQALQNLISNSLNHGGSAVHIEANENEKFWQFKVSDNGPGIEEAYQTMLFEPFKRMNAHESQGLGMGLAICRRIAEAHGGRIWYEANPQGGAVFFFTIAKAEKAAN